ncbi:hypothetical protein FRAHR75_1630003 [Frankia sp. Hr75.2]|nr:hypothetical protein FRAHR75_1630003 [Frankia sp. Hr75.2]
MHQSSRPGRKPLLILKKIWLPDRVTGIRADQAGVPFQLPGFSSVGEHCDRGMVGSGRE